MPIDSGGSKVTRDFHRRPPAERSTSIWLCSTMPLSEQRPKSRRSSCRPPTQRRVGQGRTAAKPYSTNYLVDVENAIIVDVEATTAIRQAEVLAAKRMIERSLERFDLYPSRLLGDSGYGSGRDARYST